MEIEVQRLDNTILLSPDTQSSIRNNIEERRKRQSRNRDLQKLLLPLKVAAEVAIVGVTILNALNYFNDQENLALVTGIICGITAVSAGVGQVMSHKEWKSRMDKIDIQTDKCEQELDRGTLFPVIGEHRINIDKVITGSTPTSKPWMN